MPWYVLPQIVWRVVRCEVFAKDEWWGGGVADVNHVIFCIWIRMVLVTTVSQFTFTFSLEALGGVLYE